jgi:hypothetical protein
MDLTLGAQGIIFPSTTVMPLVPSNAGMPYFLEATGEMISADGALFSFGPTNVVIDGTTYSCATPTDVVVGGGQATVSIGLDGLHLIASPATGQAQPAIVAASGAGGSELGDAGVALLGLVVVMILL